MVVTFRASPAPGAYRQQEEDLLARPPGKQVLQPGCRSAGLDSIHSEALSLHPAPSPPPHGGFSPWGRRE